MRRLLSNLALLIFGCFVSVSTLAALNIQITKGSQAALPIAVIPFQGQSVLDKPTNTELNANDNIASVVTNDLKNSGYFRVASIKSLTQFPHTFAEINPAFWRNQQFDNVLIGTVTPTGSNQVTVETSLISVATNQSQVLLTRQYTVNKQDLRRLAHHISDVVYEELTGQKGVFSTQIAYIVVKRKSSQTPTYYLEVADFDGKNPVVLLESHEPIMSPAWSPDGKQLAYVSFENKQSQIYSHDITTGKRVLMSNYEGINGAPAWSPDATQLALVLSKSGYPKIYTLDLKTHALRQLTQGWSIDTEPVWAKDGKSIYFTSDRGGSPQIYQINLKNLNVKRITFSGTFNASPSLSAKGNEMALLHNEGHGFEISVYDLVNDQMTTLTRSGRNQSPTIAPNGQLVMYATRFGGRAVLSIVATDDSVSMRLPARGGDVQEPAWSPFLG